ncbi:DUF928 domain-containing protein [Chamaesiphon sp. VAR_48_metabat_135_sub]|uniref:DUF928 domain-containing protein n=1 Tax=Chamaesiphon sp. VAR_48_metabat_135_sub TaxID=2964699 RepID=UPI00286B9B33|nr:DUF928 domain-containing protein [Chamaesiphon sp. VAR_48_metabat_135_sub]
MKTAHPLHQITQNLRLVTIFFLSAIVTITSPTLANPPTPPQPSLKIRWKPPIPPSSLGIPGNRAQGGGTRGCQPYRGITALVPKLPGQIFWGQTIDDRPTVWLNTPQGLERDLLMEIAVREQNGKLLAKQSSTTKRKISSGTIGILFPPTAVLKIDRTYHWTVAFYCDTDERVDRPFLVQAQIGRIAPPTALTTAKSDLESIQILAENGIWYDALTQIGDRFRKTKDRKTATVWAALLKSAGINGSDRIQDCCQ